MTVQRDNGETTTEESTVEIGASRNKVWYEGNNAVRRGVESVLVFAERLPVPSEPSVQGACGPIYEVREGEGRGEDKTPILMSRKLREGKHNDEGGPDRTN